MRAYIYDNLPVSPFSSRCFFRAVCTGRRMPRRRVENAVLTRPPHTPQGDQRLPHDSGKSVDVDALQKLGVLYYRFGDVAGVDELAAQRGYKNRDEITVSPEKMGDVYEAKVKMFFDEHLHEDEEIRYIRGGHGYFDVRNMGDDWVRIALEKVRHLPSSPLIPRCGIPRRHVLERRNGRLTCTANRTT